MPVVNDGHKALILEKKTANNRRWNDALVRSLDDAYRDAPAYREISPAVSDLLRAPWHHVADVAIASVELGFRFLGRRPATVRASALGVDAADAQDRVIALVRAVSGTRYLSGPAAKDYIADDSKFRDAGIELTWMQYSYPPYPQQRPYTEAPLSILDLLFNVGSDASRYIWPSAALPAADVASA